MLSHSQTIYLLRNAMSREIKLVGGAGTVRQTNWRRCGVCCDATFFAAAPAVAPFSSVILEIICCRQIGYAFVFFFSSLASFCTLNGMHFNSTVTQTHISLFLHTDW